MQQSRTYQAGSRSSKNILTTKQVHNKVIRVSAELEDDLWLISYPVVLHSLTQTRNSNPTFPA